MSKNKDQVLLAILGVILFGLISAVSLLMMINFARPANTPSLDWFKTFNIRQNDWLKVK